MKRPLERATFFEAGLVFEIAFPSSSNENSYKSLSNISSINAVF
jgi:hypothetical protein